MLLSPVIAPHLPRTALLGGEHVVTPRASAPTAFDIPVNFGVEIEMSNIGLQRMRVEASEILAVPTPRESSSRWAPQDPVRGRDGRVWEVKRECDGVNELATPILSSHDDLATLCEMARSMSSAGACTLGALGLHIHVDAASLTPRDIVNLVALMARYQAPLETALQVREARRIYCKRIAPELVDLLDQVKTSSRDNFATACLQRSGGRDRNLNLTNLVKIKQHTLEFRLFNATLRPDVLVHYVAIVMGIVGAAKSSVLSRTHLSRSDAPTLSQFCAHIGLHPHRGTGAFLMSRASACA